MNNITIEELLKLNLKEIQLVDIRENNERVYFHIKESIHIPKDELVNRLEELDINKEIYLICKTWNRTAFMTNVLTNLWYKAINVLWWIVEYNKITQWK